MAREFAVKLDAVRLDLPGAEAAPPLQLTVGQGDHVCLLGDAASGSAEVVALVAGMRRAREGSAEALGAPIHGPVRGAGWASATRPRRRVGGTVRASILHAAASDGASAARRSARLAEMLHWMELETVADFPASELYGWNEVALRLAVALAARPPLLLISHALDLAPPAALARIAEYLEARRAGDGLAILEATSSAELAARAGTTGLMHRSGLLALDSPERLLRLAPDEWVEAEIADPPDAERALGEIFQIEVAADGRIIRFQSGAPESVAAHLFRHGVGGVRAVMVQKNDLWSVLRHLERTAGTP